MKAKYTLTVFKVLLFECKSVLQPAQRVTRIERVKNAKECLSLSPPKVFCTSNCSEKFVKRLRKSSVVFYFSNFISKNTLPGMVCYECFQIF